MHKIIRDKAEILTDSSRLLGLILRFWKCLLVHFLLALGVHWLYQVLLQDIVFWLFSFYTFSVKMRILFGFLSGNFFKISFKQNQPSLLWKKKPKWHKSNFLKVRDTCIDFLILSLFFSSFLLYFIYLFWPCRLACGILVP